MCFFVWTDVIFIQMIPNERLEAQARKSFVICLWLPDPRCHFLISSGSSFERHRRWPKLAERVWFVRPIFRWENTQMAVQWEWEFQRLNQILVFTPGIILACLWNCYCGMGQHDWPPKNRRVHTKHRSVISVNLRFPGFTSLRIICANESSTAFKGQLYIYTQHLYVYVYCYAGQIHIFHSPHLPGRGRAPHQWPEPGGEGSFQTISEGGSTDQPHPYFLSFPGWFWWSQEGFIFRHSQERVWSQIRKYEPPWKP